MTLHKLQHFFSRVFLLILVGLQGLIFVASQARVEPDLSVSFVSPSVNQSIVAGDIIGLKANLSADDDFSIVYLQIKNSQANISLNFEAQKEAGGAWVSLAAWDTTDWPAGYYQLSALAHVYDSHGYLTESFESIPQQVYLAYPVEMSQVDEDGQLPIIPDPEPEKETPTSLSASVISPNVQTVSSTIDLKIEFNQNLLDSQAVSAYLIFGTSTAATLNLQSLDNIQYSATLDTAAYQNGDYNLIFYVENEEIASTDFTINNPLQPAISLVSPATGAEITANSFVFNLSTNFVATDLTIEFINSADPAISTGELSVASTDSYSWNKTINLGSSFVDGAYRLIARAGEVEASFDFTLDLIDETIGWPDSPDQIVLDIYALGPNLSGTVLAQASSTFAGLVLDFVAKDSVAKQEVGRFASVYFGNMYGANIDTLTLPNGNYYLTAETVFQDTVVESNSILVSIFNPSQEQNVETAATTTPSTTPESVIANNNQAVIVQAQGPLFSRQTTCLSAGILDEKACLIFRGLLDETLDTKCIVQNILEPLACEDYLNLVYVEGDCKSAGIIDHEQCKDYLLEKYSGSIDCRLDDQSACRDILRNTYLNRLVLDIKKQENIYENFSSSIGQNISLESLTQNFSEISWPLSSGQGMILSSSNEIVLSKDNSLTVDNGLLIALDADQDNLPDDLEKYYGTDPQNPDSDNDGYTDAIEIKNNYNPLGEGVLEKDRHPLDQAIFSGSSIRQPKLDAQNIDNNLQVQSISNFDNKIKLAGQAPANTWLNIFIYSDVPLLASVQTDESGNWSYTVPQNMPDGHHRIYLAVNDTEGRIVKQSAPASFLVKSAHAVTAEEFFGAGMDAQIETDNWTMYYVIGGGILLIILVIVASYLFVHRSKNSYNPL